MCNRKTFAVWMVLLLVVAQHHSAHSLHHNPSEQFSSFMGLLTAAHMPTVTAYHDISNYTAALPLPLLRNGIVYGGDNGRLRRVVHNLLHGKPTSIGVIGGSVSYGYGVHRGSDDWFSVLTSYLRKAFPHASIRAKNGCAPAAQTESISMCLDNFINHDVDLLFVEFATSDGYLDTSVNNPYVHAFERLIRKLLKLPNRPAIVLVNFLHKDAVKRNSQFYHTIEDHYGVLAQYYQLPWLSVRDAVWLGLQHDWDGFRAHDMFLASDRHPWLPNSLGHKYIADLAVGLIQQTYWELMLAPLSAADMPYSEDIPGPMFPHNYDSQYEACAIGIQLNAAVAADQKDWYFVNEGSVLKPRWGFVSYVPNSTLVVRLDTRENSSHHIPQLTAQQKLQILQRHGMFAAAAQLQATMSRLQHPRSTPTAAIMATAGMRSAADGVNPQSATTAADGVEAAREESLRQAAAVAQMMKSGQFTPFVGRERIVGAQGSRFRLPPDAHKIVGSTTATGVEVVMNSGKRLLTAAAGQSATATAALRAERRSSSSSSLLNHDSSSRMLLGAPNPNVVPPPLDAVYLKPVGSSVLSALGGKANSIAQADMIVWIGYQKSHRLMGTARLHCLSGCVCQEIFVDAWLPESTSRLAMAKLRVTQHEQCELGVQLLGPSHNGQTNLKFKVTAVMVSRAVEYRNEDAHADSALMGVLEDAGHGSIGGR